MSGEPLAGLSGARYRVATTGGRDDARELFGCLGAGALPLDLILHPFA